VVLVTDESFDKSDNFPILIFLGWEIVEDIGAALEQFRKITADLGMPCASSKD
jgi:hypothetical protein